jgi:uncharacterized phage-associated protein
MEKALAVANEVILLAKAAGNPPTQMKLQKLMYFAHGWHLALADASLIDEQFEAWKYGPVVPSVYHEFKHYGILPISTLGTEAQVIGKGSIQWVPPQLINGTGYTAALLRRIWHVFGGYGGNQLSAMTHVHDSPWVKNYSEGMNKPIPNEDIKSYFKSVMARDG